jgi:hypothetical protein
MVPHYDPASDIRDYTYTTLCKYGSTGRRRHCTKHGGVKNLINDKHDGAYMRDSRSHRYYSTKEEKIDTTRRGSSVMTVDGHEIGVAIQDDGPDDEVEWNRSRKRSPSCSKRGAET